MNEYINGKDIKSINSCQVKDIVDGLIPIGVTIFGAPQKIGKTLFCLQLANAVANGNDFLEHTSKQGCVLYIAFEDSKYSIKKRYDTFGMEVSENLEFYFAQAGQIFDLEQEVKMILQKYNDLCLVIVDTFAKIRNCPQTEYQFEYQEISKIHEIAMKYNLSILLVTHVTKKIDYTTPFDSIYGSRGITAGADSMMVMFQHRQYQDLKEMFVTGKDIIDDHIILKRNENLLYERIEQEVDVEIDEDILKVIHHVVNKKEIILTHEKLCSELNLPITGKMLSSKIRKDKDFLLLNFIKIEYLPRRANARLIKLSYVGDDVMTEEDAYENA